MPSTPPTSQTVIITPRLTCPDTTFRPPVAGHDLLTRTGTVHFRDLPQETEPAAPDRQTSLACTHQLDTSTDARRRCLVACSLVRTGRSERASVLAVASA